MSNGSEMMNRKLKLIIVIMMIIILTTPSAMTANVLAEETGSEKQITENTADSSGVPDEQTENNETETDTVTETDTATDTEETNAAAEESELSGTADSSEKEDHPAATEQDVDENNEAETKDDESGPGSEGTVTEKSPDNLETDKTEEEQTREIAKMLGMKVSYVRELLNFNRDMISLDAPIDATKSETAVGDAFKDDINPTPEQQALTSALKSDVETTLKTLKPKAERVLRMRYGIGGYKAMSLKEIGDACGLTKERIRQIEKGAVQMLQSPSRRRRLEAYVA